MVEFERLLQENYVFLERYVKYKVGNLHDAEDIIQEVCLTATLVVNGELYVHWYDCITDYIL